MARTIEIEAPTGLTLTCELIAKGDNVLIETIVLTERSVAKQVYLGTIVTAVTGLYKVLLKVGANYIGIEEFLIDGVDGTISRSAENTMLEHWHEMVEDDAGVQRYTTHALMQGPAGSGGGLGTGARTVLVTVTDSTVPIPVALQNARVRFYQGAESYVGSTDVNGQITFNLDDATWTVAITKAGYSFAGTTLVVDGNETPTYVMTAIVVVPPANPIFCVLLIRVWNLNGTVASGADVTVRVDVASGGTGEIFDKSPITVSTGLDGYASFTVPKNSSIKYYAGDEQEHSDDIGSSDVQYVENQMGIIE